MCPVCTVGVAVGVGLSRWLKIDDAISGIWIGALILALAIWTWQWLYRKKDKKPFIVLGLLVFGFWLLTFIPLDYAGLLDGCTTLGGMNRLVFGSLIGVIAAAIGILMDKYIRSKKEGKAAFSYQKVILPLSLLILASLIMASICY